MGRSLTLAVLFRKCSQKKQYRDRKGAAMERLPEVTTLFDEMGDRKGSARALRVSATARQIAGDRHARDGKMDKAAAAWDLAMRDAMQSLHLAEEGGWKREIAATLDTLGELLVRRPRKERGRNEGGALPPCPVRWATSV